MASNLQEEIKLFKGVETEKRFCKKISLVRHWAIIPNLFKEKGVISCNKAPPSFQI